MHVRFEILTSVTIKIVINPEDVGNELLWNVSNDLPDYTTSYLKAIISTENTICKVSLN
jgi:hypothetical protein